MPAYAVTMRIQPVRPHRAEPSRAYGELASASDRHPTAEVVDLVGTSIDERVAGWWSAVAETWAQTTFFLFDPESWR